MKTIKLPVLLAAGDHDSLGPGLESLLDIFRLIPNAQLAIVPDADHFVLNENPMKLWPIIRSFLDEPISPVPFAAIRTGYHPGETR